MTLALESERLGHEVLMIESGGREPSSETGDASKAHIVDPDCHAPMEIAVCRALGGTSWTWGGRCVAYDDIDWMDRDFVQDAHWPLKHDELRPWYKRATEYLLCGSDQFSIPYNHQLSQGLTFDFVERWAREPKVILEHRDHLYQSARIMLSLSSTLSALNLSSGGDRVESLSVSTRNGPATVTAKKCILAMGGVETTRLLLHTQRDWPEHFGGANGPLGRYYMGHISGKIANVVFDDPKTFRDFDFKLDAPNKAYYRRRLMLSANVQMKSKVLNTAFWPDNPPFHDPGHRSGVLSSVFLALVFPPTGRKLLPDGIRLAHTGQPPYKLAAHMRNVLLGVPAGA